MRLDEAIDLYLGDQALRGRSARTLDDYRRKLDVLAAQNERRDVDEISVDDCRRALDRWAGRAPGTVAHSVSVYSSLFRWLHEEGRIEANPMARIRRPRLPSPDELDVATVTRAEVRRLLVACETWQETLCVSLLVYLGPRRRALSRLRVGDVDFERRTVRFREKGGRVAVKPMPDALALILTTARDDGAIGNDATAYVVPMLREQRRQGDRDDRLIWRTYRRVAARAGIGGHVHALRAAFAVRYLETHPGDLEALQSLLGHRRVTTTEVYLRKLNRGRAMERVRDLTWDAPFETMAEEAPTRFELVYEALQASA